ncbi:hypothetical protein [Sulfurimonas sp.]|uniref:hypothetical protein n=1 Tax=Sulfurimonas sp. TaxID=2022749 RepID=UPI002635AD2B|nr:hypothetical protein [Sulfurimonas sp.]MDD3856373.1 hypothetical protein [Sulfurimonas sp.]
MKLLSGFISIHLKIFFWFFLAAGVVFFVDSTVANFSKEVQNLKNEKNTAVVNQEVHIPNMPTNTLPTEEK